MTSKGIDYGHGMANIDQETGIRYGVIPMHSVCQFWCDSSEPHNTPYCPHCGNVLDLDAANPEGEIEFPCPHCGKQIRDDDVYGDDADFWYINDSEYTAECSDTDIFITRSKYFTYAQFCSPCAPGACHLSNPIEEKDENNRCYCFGHDCFDDGKAPYTVYSVETREIVEPEQN